jgi:hypothetical protein
MNQQNNNVPNQVHSDVVQKTMTVFDTIIIDGSRTTW